MSAFKRIIVKNRFQKNHAQKSLTFRSNWEVAFANFLDGNKNVKECKNDYPMRYRDKFNTQKLKTYYIDFFVNMTDGTTMLIEVKPLKSLQMRVTTKSIRYKQIHTTNYLKNLAKFEMVEMFCQKMKWKFFLTEKGDSGFKFYRWDISNKKPVSV